MRDLTSNCSADGARPQRARITRLRDSPTLSLRPSANVTARVALRLPGVPAMSNSRVSQHVVVEQPAVQRGIEADDRGFVR